MADESSGAAGFFGNSASDDSLKLEEHIQNSEASFEDVCVRRLLKIFNVDPSSWILREIVAKGDRLRFPIFDEAHTGFPVRLGTRRIVARNATKASRARADFAFHEFTPVQLFNHDELRKTQVYKAWDELAEDQSEDGRPVGLVFSHVNTLYILHDWSRTHHRHRTVAGLRLEWLWPGDEPRKMMILESFPQFLEIVKENGWTP